MRSVGHTVGVEVRCLQDPHARDDRIWTLQGKVSILTLMYVNAHTTGSCARSGHSPRELYGS